VFCLLFDLSAFVGLDALMSESHGKPDLAETAAMVTDVLTMLTEGNFDNAETIYVLLTCINEIGALSESFHDKSSAELFWQKVSKVGVLDSQNMMSVIASAQTDSFIMTTAGNA
jgi:hypothetical protein